MNQTTDFNSLLNQADEDSLRSGILESDVYPATIEVAYSGVSAGGAKFIALQFKLDNGAFFRENLYYTNRQGNELYTGQNGKQALLPGRIRVESLCEVACNKPFTDTTRQEKVIKLYDYKAKSELPTSVQMIPELENKKVQLGLLKHRENKRVQNSKTNQWEKGPDAVESNKIAHLFHDPSGLTRTEMKAGETEGAFIKVWKKANWHKTKDTFTPIKTEQTFDALPELNVESNSGSETPELFPTS